MNVEAIRAKLPPDQAAIAEQLSNERWRLRNLYMIQPKKGPICPFVPNVMQERFIDEMWYKNIILKARQHGFSTFIAIFFLDRLLFGGGDVKAGIIDLTLEDAKIKLAKIKLAYREIGKSIGGEAGIILNKMLHQMYPLEQSSALSMTWTNRSSVRVGTAFTGDTLQYLHVSEFGKIAYKKPEVASEIVQSAIPASEQGMVFFESTHRGGKQGLHYNRLREAQERTEHGPKDFMFHFYGWQDNPEYRDPNCTPRLAEEDVKYFSELERDYGITLDKEQKAFWARQKREQDNDLDKMLKEFPAVPEDAYSSSIEGAIYGRWISMARREGRIRAFNHQDRYQAYCFWDLGIADYTSIWCVQLCGPDIFWLDWYEDHLQEPAHYASVVREWATRYPIAGHFMPHDAGHKIEGVKTRVDQYKEAGVKNITVMQVPKSRLEGINELRPLLKCSYFHTRCAEPRVVNGQQSHSGVDHLEMYAWHEIKAGSIVKKEPKHDEHSHSADAARVFAEAFSRGMIGREVKARANRDRRNIVIPA